MRLLFFSILAASLSWCHPAWAEDHSYRRIEKLRTDPVLRAELQQILEAGLHRAFGEPAPAKNPSEFFQTPLPVFITLKKGGKVRGCMGSLYPKSGTLADEIARNLEWALFRDPRHRAVQRQEISGMEVYLTAVGNPVPVKSIDSISPANDGAYLRYGSKEAVVLPGEAKTQRYLLALLKAKAGIKKGEAYRLYRLSSSTLDPILLGGFNSN